MLGAKYETLKDVGSSTGEESECMLISIMTTYILSWDRSYHASHTPRLLPIQLYQG
jgi:hypothetical protein